MTNRLQFVGVVLLAGWLAQPAAAADSQWPQWRGPQRDDVSSETGLLQSWPEGGPKRLWLFENTGLGYSGPAIVGDRLYILGARDAQEELICLRVSDGQEIWSTPIGPILENDWGDGPRSTPTVDGELIYALGGQGNLVCARAKDGNIVWSKTMQDFDGAPPFWGYSESPLVHQDQLLCTPGGEQGAIVALNKATGDLLWQTEELTDTAHYASIVLQQHAGKTLAVQLLVGQLVGVDINDGNVLWTVPWPGRVAVVPTPIVWKDSIYVTSGYGAGCMMVRLGEGDSAEQIYANKVMSNHHGGVIRLGNFLYGHSNKKGWTCQDFETGETVWRERKALGKGAIAYADGRFYCLDEDEGEVVLIEASPEGWSEHGRFHLEPLTTLRKPKGKVWTHPVITGGRLFFRDQQYLFCYDVRK